MDRYVTGDVIRALRETKGLTQEELAGRLFVSGKAVSKWETGRGYPDVSLLEPLAAALGISVIELLSGQPVKKPEQVCQYGPGQMVRLPRLRERPVGHRRGGGQLLRHPPAAPGAGGTG